MGERRHRLYGSRAREAVGCNVGDEYRQLKFMPASLTFGRAYTQDWFNAHPTHRRVTYVRTHFVSHVMKQWWGKARVRREVVHNRERLSREHSALATGNVRNYSSSIPTRSRYPSMTVSDNFYALPIFRTSLEIKAFSRRSHERYLKLVCFR